MLICSSYAFSLSLLRNFSISSRPFKLKFSQHKGKLYCRNNLLKCASKKYLMLHQSDGVQRPYIERHMGKYLHFADTLTCYILLNMHHFMCNDPVNNVKNWFMPRSILTLLVIVVISDIL